MNSIANAIRQKRFAVKPDSTIVAHVQTPAGSVHKLRVLNCSMRGLAAFCESELPEEDGLVEGAVLPPAKMVGEGLELFIGRLVLRVKRAETNRVIYGFQTIDSSLPVDGPLSKHIDMSDADRSSAYDYELDPNQFTLASFIHSDQTNNDLFARCNQFGIMFRKWRESPKYQYKSIRLPSSGPRIKMSRKRKGSRNDYIIMGSNDYLGLADHPEVKAAAIEGIQKYGFGSTGSQVTTGYTEAHEQLCDELAKTFRKDKTVLFNSGYAANLGILAGLTSESDLVIADMLAHASIQDGMELSKATARYFKHNHAPHLDKILKRERQDFDGALVVTEGIFSMDGDVADLPSIIKVAKKYNARVMCDEAHSFGVIGETGIGAIEKYNAFDDVDIAMGTFSKICGGIGGFVCADTDVVDWIYHFARSAIFSVSIPPSTALAALKALHVFKSDTSLLENLRCNINHFCEGLRELGFQVAPDHESAVVPVSIGCEKTLGEMNKIMLDEGVFVVPIVYPAVARNRCRFRFTMMATHTLTDLDFALNVLEKAMLKTGFSPQPQLRQVA
jgi:8-amino-7-oxononanoate synthase